MGAGDADALRRNVLNVLCLAICAYWTVVQLLWIANAFWFHKHRPIMLHRVIMQALIIHWLRSWLMYGAQALLSANVHDGGLRALSVMAGLADFIYVSYWFVILLQISMGWSIIRYEFLPSEYRAFGMVVIALGCAELIGLVDEGFYVVSLVLYYLMVVRIVFVASEASIRHIEDEAHRGNVQADSVLYQAARGKLRMVRLPKIIIVFYTVLHLLSQIITYFMFSDNTIVEYLMEEAVSLPLLTWVCIRFRLQDFTAYYSAAADEARPPAAVELAPVSRTASTETMTLETALAELATLRERAARAREVGVSATDLDDVAAPPPAVPVDEDGSAVAKRCPASQMLVVHLPEPEVHPLRLGAAADAAEHARLAQALDLRPLVLAVPVTPMRDQEAIRAAAWARRHSQAGPPARRSTLRVPPLRVLADAEASRSPRTAVPVTWITGPGTLRTDGADDSYMILGRILAPL